MNTTLLQTQVLSSLLAAAQSSPEHLTKFPALMAAALTNQDLRQWAATQDIALIRAGPDHYRLMRSTL